MKQAAEHRLPRSAADLGTIGDALEMLREAAERRSREVALYLLCEADVPYAPDPQRCFPEESARQDAARRWRETIAARALPNVAIRGDWAERERAAIAAVAGILNGPTKYTKDTKMGQGD